MEFSKYAGNEEGQGHHYQWCRANLLDWLPHFIVIAWLLFLGLMIWQHVLNSAQPPIYDSLSYMQKAINFWQAIDGGRFVNPFNVDPTSRPPGTILMSYPFGFTPDYHGFLFRSVFLPILCVVFAVYIAAGSAHLRPDGWKVASTAILLTTLPMFYHLELVGKFTQPVHWGLVDNFQAGIAAMAAAAAVRSLTNRSLCWLTFSLLLATFTLFVKPSGLMVMAMLAVIWILVTALESKCMRTQGETLQGNRRYILLGSMSAVLVFGVAIALCASSKYISQQNLFYAQQALVVMKSELAVPLSELFRLFHASSGEAIVIWIIGTLVCLLMPIAVASNVRALGGIPVRIKSLIVSCLIVWCLGGWYWLIVQSGGNQIRYFYPFMLMGIVLLIPVAIHVWKNSPYIINMLFLIVSLLPAINLAALLIQNSPSDSWQKVSGVNVSVGKGRDIAAQANEFIQKLRKHNIRPKLYSFSTGVPGAVFENIGMFEEMVRPVQPIFNVQRPIDWTRGFVVRRNEILASEYILIPKIDEKTAQRQMMLRNINNFNDESNIFQAWLTGLDKRAGIQIISESSELRLLNIYDQSRFQEHLDKFIASRSWRREFIRATQPIWWSTAAINDYDKNAEVSNITFGGVYQLQNLRLDYLNKGVKVEIWWKKSKNELAHINRKMFFHLIDDAGNIIYNNEISLYPYDPPGSDRTWRYDSVEFPLALANKKISGMAFGVFHPDTGDFLLADSYPKRDWEGRRVLVPITKELD